MLLDIDVVVQNKTVSYDSEGVAQVIWTASQTIEKANKQPLSGEVAYLEFGISDATIVSLFFVKTSTSAIEGGRIVYGTETYDIYRIEKYSNHYEVIVKLVVS